MKELCWPFDGEYIINHRKKIKKALLAEETKRVKKKIAVLGGSTTHDIVCLLELFLLNQGIEPEFYESEYNQYYGDGVFGNELLDNFAPDIIYIHTSFRNINVPFPQMGDTKETVDGLIEAQLKHFRTLWDALKAKFRCPIIQNNFELPFYRLQGNRDCWDYRGKVNFVNRLNMLFATEAEARQDFYINDINYISACYGLDRWSEPFYWYMYKYCCSLDAMPDFAYNLSNIVKSVFGRNKKAFALDLDNTLWGGVVGDDGVDGIDVGREVSTGQCYYEFQSYLKEYKQLGVLLNVASKNDMENAVAGLKHPSGVLKPEDFTVIKANWDAKSKNVADTAKMLDLLPESFVFVDDNPAERQIVADYIPGVSVPEMTKPEEYIRIIDRSGFFEVTSYSADDAKRVEMYKANAQRALESESFTDYNEYLLNLKMVGTIEDFKPVYLARITQLTNKSNQFNLTTRRYTESEMAEISEKNNYIRLYGRLQDKFGDNGIVSVVIGEIKETEGVKSLHVDLWLMSCRVLKRKMEQAMLDTLVEKAQAAGVEKIYGYYYPTAKNHMVENLYGEFGFEKLSEDSGGNTVWVLKTEGYAKQNDVIEVNQ